MNCLAAVAFLFGMCGGPAYGQAPSTTDALLVYPTVYEKEKSMLEARKTGIGLARKIDQEITEAEALAAQDKLKQISDTDIERIHGEIILMERVGQRFNAWGELASRDLQARAADFRIRLTKLAAERVMDKDVSTRVTRGLRRVEVDLPKVIARLPQVVQLLERKQPEQAQLLFWRLTEEIEPKTIWYGLKNVPDRPVALNSLDSYRNRCFNAAQELWRAEAKKACEDAIKSIDTDYGKLIRQADQVAAALSKQPTVELDGDKQSGPAAVEAIGERWRKLDVASQQVRGWGWYNGRLGGDNKVSLVIAQRSHSRNVAAALGRIIAADAARVKPEEAAELYNAYVTSLTPLVLLVGDPSILSPVQESLGTLAGRAPTLLEEVTAYQNATGEVLRWRERIAGAVARSRMAQAPSIEQVARTIAKPEQENIGPLLNTNQSQLVARATHPVPVLMARLAGLVGKPATALGLVSLGPEKTLAISNYQQPTRCYVKVAPDAAKPAITALAADLLSTDTQPPLTLDARAALEGAKMGDLMAAGGPILKLGLVTWGEHFGQLPTAQRGPVRLGPIPSDFVGENELVLLVQLDARWMAGRYYCVDVPAAEK